MKILNYTVKVHPAEEGGFWAEVPELPGCFTQGETIEEIAVMAREAIECYLASLAKDGVRAPIERVAKKNKVRPFFIPLAVRAPKLA